MSKHKLMLMIYIILQIISTISSEHIEMKLDIEEKGEIKKDDSFIYYKLIIPANISETKNLVFEVKADKSALKEGEEIFSDPDIHISKTEQFPSKYHSDWYSERYGDDIISIGKENVKTNDIFYIGMYCEYKCKYKIKAYLSQSVKINIGEVYSFLVKKGSSANYYFELPNEDYNEYVIIASSPYMNEFKFYSAQENPSAQNNLPFTPSWAGGYAVSIEKGSKHYCKDCQIHILLVGNDKEDASVQVYSYFKDKSTLISPNSPVSDFAKSRSQRCYQFDVDYDKLKSLNGLIIQATLFSGRNILYINGWESRNLKFEDLYKNLTYVYRVSNEIAIYLKKKDFDYFDSKYQGQETNKKLSFCLYSRESSSYVISAYFIDDATALQKYNYLFPNAKINGYLLKDQVTRYRILEYAEKSDIGVTISVTKGNIESYVYFCSEGSCYFTSELITEKKKDMLVPETNVFGDHIFNITDSINKCHDKKFTSKLACSPLVVIKCIEFDLCAFKVTTTSKSIPIFMSPRTTYYNILPAKQFDTYQIVVEDEDVNSTVIVLNTASGDAELFVYKETENNNKKELIGLSLNDDYIPDVVRITSNKLKDKTLIGKYLIKVTSKTFSAYNLYYYTTKKVEKEKEKDVPIEITSEISAGELLSDIYPVNTQFKVYSYTPVSIDSEDFNEDIKITLHSDNLKFDFKVYLDIKDISYTLRDNATELFTGYTWAADSNSELLIKKSDNKYTAKGPYYILVHRNFDITKTNRDAIASFHLDVTNKNTPITLLESKEHDTVLTSEYNTQSYWYNHFDLNNDLQLMINLYKGMVHVYISDRKFELDKVDKTKLIKYQEYIRSTMSINIKSEELKKVFGQNDNCNLYILVAKASLFNDCNYLIVGKSREKKMELITPGVIKESKILPGKTQYYVVEEMTARKASTIVLHVKSSGLSIYVRIPEKPENGENIKYPSESNFDFTGQKTYMGEYIQLPEYVFNKLSETNPKIQIQIAIVADKKSDEDKEEIAYKLTYSSDPKKLSQNEPFTQFITAGEAHYFQIRFDDKTENIYISLSNMNGGDADLYVNYGLVKLPTTAEFDWSSNKPGHEFISIKKSDAVFKKFGKETLEGDYSILVIGFTDTSYTLFVSSGNEVIFPIMENSPITCKCEKEGDKCYFNYPQFDGLYNSNFNSTMKKEFNIMFYSDYLYGRGKLYTSLMQSDRFYQLKNVLDAFPNEKEKYITDERLINKNLLELKIKSDNKDINANSLVLVTLQCMERSQVDLTMATGSVGETFRLDEDRVNIFYFDVVNKDKLLLFYNYMNSELIYDVEIIDGDISAVVYVNKTMYSDETKTILHKYTHLASFHINKRQSQDEEQLMENYQNSIIPSELLYNENVVFKISPIKPSVFKIKINYSNKWVNMPVNVPKNFLSKKNGVLGYFDIQPEYNSVEFSIVLDEKVGKRANVFIKYHILEKNSKDVKTNVTEEQAYNYKIPSITNYDYRIKTDKVVGAGNKVLSKFPSIQKEQILRVLFSVSIVKYSENDPDDENEYKEEDLVYDTPFKITVSPKIEGGSVLYTTQKIYHYTTDKYDPNNKYSKTFLLSTNSALDDTMVIEIASCKGSYEYKINEVSEGQIKSTPIKYNKNSYNGKEVITLSNLKSINYQIEITPINKIPFCRNPEASRNPICTSDVSYLFYYYSTTADNYKYSLINPVFTYNTYGRGGIQINIPNLKESDAFGNERDLKDMHFDVFVSESEIDFSKMESVCYLSEMSKDTQQKKLYKNIKIKNGKIIVKGLKSGQSYYVNILAENPKTKELITFKPIQVISGNLLSSFSGWLLVLLIVGVVALGGASFYLYKRLKITQAELSYENNDLNRLGNLSRPETEMGNISSSNNIKYSSLALDTDKI